MLQKFWHFFICLWVMPVFYDSIGWIASYLQLYLVLRRKRAGYILLKVKHLQLPSHNSNSTFSHSSVSQEAAACFVCFHSVGHMSKVWGSLPKTNTRLYQKIYLCLLPVWTVHFAFLFGTVESVNIYITVRLKGSGPLRSPRKHVNNINVLVWDWWIDTCCQRMGGALPHHAEPQCQQSARGHPALLLGVNSLPLRILYGSSSQLCQLSRSNATHWSWRKCFTFDDSFQMHVKWFSGLT